MFNAIYFIFAVIFDEKQKKIKKGIAEFGKFFKHPKFLLLQNMINT